MKLYDQASDSLLYETRLERRRSSRVMMMYATVPYILWVTCGLPACPPTQGMMTTASSCLPLSVSVFLQQTGQQ
jgi:hypothetical protein